MGYISGVKLELSDDELDMVSGGGDKFANHSDTHYRDLAAEEGRKIALPFETCDCRVAVTVYALKMDVRTASTADISKGNITPGLSYKVCTNCKCYYCGRLAREIWLPNS